MVAESIAVLRGRKGLIMSNSSGSTSSDDRRRRSYAAGAIISKETMARDAPDHHAALEQIEAADIVVVPGSYDHVEWVLTALDMPHTVVSPAQVAGLDLRPDQLLVVNCPGQIGERAVEQVSGFVAAGGSLFTTDWALRHVLEPAFPGVVAYNDRPTADVVVRVEITDHDNPFLKGVIETGDDPQWWLEGSSYPIRILDADRVRVLLRSAELESKWGEAPVAISFGHGEGEVFHMISHYYLQRTETRSRRHRAPASAYAAEKGVAWDAIKGVAEDLGLADVESAASSARLFANVAAVHKMRAQARIRRERDEKASTAPARDPEVSPPGGR